MRECRRLHNLAAGSISGIELNEKNMNESQVMRI